MPVTPYGEDQIPRTLVGMELLQVHQEIQVPTGQKLQMAETIAIEQLEVLEPSLTITPQEALKAIMEAQGAVLQEAPLQAQTAEHTETQHLQELTLQVAQPDQVATAQGRQAEELIEVLEAAALP